MPDYQIEIFLKNGEVRQTDYEKLIQALGVKDHDALSTALWWRKIGKLRYMAGVLKEKYPKEVEEVKIFGEDGKEL